MNPLPNDNNTNLHLYILDPLSVIVKLAIINNKPLGTKMRICNNVIYLQEPGPFQSLCRFFLKSNKTDIKYLYNPIDIACKTYLTSASIQQNPKIKDLFKCAQSGLAKLGDTYSQCAVIQFCLKHYGTIITNHLEGKPDTIFTNDNMSHFYTSDILEKLHKHWTQEKIKIILNLTTFLSQDANAETNVKSLETIMNGMDELLWSE